MWGKTHSWPSMPAALRGNLANAREMGRFAQGLQPAVSSLPAAPAGTVTRNSLMDAAPNPDNVRATVSRNAFDTQRSAPEQGPPMSAFRQDRAVPQAPDAARFGPDPQQGPPMSSFKQDRVGATPLTGKQDRLGTPAPSAERFGTPAPSTTATLGTPAPGRMMDAPKVGELATPGFNKALAEAQTAKPAAPATVSRNPFDVQKTAPVQGPPMTAMAKPATTSALADAGGLLAGQPAPALAPARTVSTPKVGPIQPATPVAAVDPSSAAAVARTTKTKAEAETAKKSAPFGRLGKAATGALIGGALAGPAGAVVGGLLGSQWGGTSSPAGTGLFGRQITNPFTGAGLFGSFGNTANQGANAFGFAGPWGGGGSPGKSGSSSKSSSKSKSSSTGGNRSNSRADSAGY